MLWAELVALAEQSRRQARRASAELVAKPLQTPQAQWQQAASAELVVPVAQQLTALQEVRAVLLPPHQVLGQPQQSVVRVEPAVKLDHLLAALLA